MNSSIDGVESNTSRLERLWSGEFGDAYVDRNLEAAEARGPFWRSFLDMFPVCNVLEAGCNVGANLCWIAERLTAENVYGVDVNRKALASLPRNVPGVNAVWSPIRELPFRDRWFDLVFTMGVLIHIPEIALPIAMSEIVRCSRRYVLCGEYFAEESTEVTYHGERGALFKRDYGKLYQELFPSLRLIKQGFLSREEGWDDVTWWVFERKP